MPIKFFKVESLMKQWLKFFFLTIVLFCASVSAMAQEEVIWTQGYGGPFSVSDFGPSQKPGSAQYTTNRELADDINLVGTISRIYVHGYTPGPVSPTPSSTHYFGLSVKFYAFGADNKPGALQAEYYIPKDSPNFLFQNSGLGDLRVRIEPAFQASGRHFISVQLVIDPIVIPGSGGATAKWYWRSDNLEAVREEGFYYRDTPNSAWERTAENPGTRNLSMQLWGTRILVNAPAISQISTNNLPQAGRLKVTGDEFRHDARHGHGSHQRRKRSGQQLVGNLDHGLCFRRFDDWRGQCRSHHGGRHEQSETVDSQGTSIGKRQSAVAFSGGRSVYSRSSGSRNGRHDLYRRSWRTSVRAHAERRFEMDFQR